MVTVPAHSFVAPVFRVVTAARRNIPSVCGVLSSSSSGRMILPPRDRHRLALPLMVSLRMTGEKSTSSLRRCRDEERPLMLGIINAAAEAYRGAIPADCWHEPYMSADELDTEIAAGV